MVDIWRQIREAAGDAARQGRDTAATNLVLDGFEQAADIALGAIDLRIEGLIARVEQGEELPPGDRGLLAGLRRLRTDLEGEFREVWQQG